ncbi:TonB-dependent receptor domain-containing protein [Parendozoicomonas haliclonae]|uniref:Vitamin B12 transporter BtuB n=1 Tax=Parendozoicomonas haliclonae TaxID=1960125 RepID=A0A1X7AIF1_9GAMM|nr:TonB-dependent receptor [Parendozoicomonas haliclonae]SMA45100.1 Vitamin B12 transporter BtuB precursor [Parendozoicomonas haliclonae]
MNLNNKTTLVLAPLTLALLPLASSIHATDKVYKLEDVVITATRTAQTVDQTLAPVSVITRKDIEQSQAQSVPELLKMLPGVQVSSNGGPGASTGLFIRGTATKESIVLIDGQRIGSATLGEASLQYFDPDQIERIELVRGPKASLYGADAIGGVVNIITRAAAGKSQMSFKAGYGSDKTRSASANISGVSDTTRYHLGFSRFITDGYDRTENTVGNNSDDDFYSNSTFSTTISHDFTDDLTFALRGYQSQGNSAYDDAWNPDTSPRTTFKEQFLSSEVTYVINNWWQTGLTLSYTQDSSEARKTASPNTYMTKRHLLNWQNNFSVSENTLLTAGFDTYKDKVDSTVDYDETSRSNHAVFLQSLTTFASSDLQLSVRNDDNERYGNKATGNIAWGYNLPADMRVIASYGTAFRAPTFNELYYPNFGDPNLKPEESENVEVELRGKLQNGQWSVAVFQNTIDNLISSQQDRDAGRVVAIKEARIRGVELTGRYQIFGTDVKAAISLLDPKEIRNNQPDQLLIRRSKQELTLDISRPFGDFTIGANLLARSQFEDSNYPSRVDMPGFGVVGIRAAWQLDKTIKLEANVRNLFNKDYQTAFGYNEPSRGVFASVTWSPEL